MTRPRPTARAVASRHPRNGHHADCPYPARDADTCPICCGIRKGQPDPGDRPVLRLIITTPEPATP